jgi:hypothetical protein
MVQITATTEHTKVFCYSIITNRCWVEAANNGGSSWPTMNCHVLLATYGWLLLLTSTWTTQKSPLRSGPILLYVDSLLWRSVYRTIAYQWPYLLVPIIWLSAVMSLHCVSICCCRNVFTVLLPSSDCLYSFHGLQPSCHIASSLRLLIPSSVQVYCHLFCEGTSLWCPWSPSWMASQCCAGLNCLLLRAACLEHHGHFVEVQSVRKISLWPFSLSSTLQYSVLSAELRSLIHVSSSSGPWQPCSSSREAPWQSWLGSWHP